jgi:RNA polymerase sigma-70 factor (ECF subfamily)
MKMTEIDARKDQTRRRKNALLWHQTGGDGVDEPLLRAARSGDQGALTALMDALYPPLRRFYRGLGGAQGADDLTQEALLRVLKHLPDYRAYPGVRFEGWVFRIAYRLFLDEKRRRPTLPLPDWERPDPSGGPEESALKQDQAEAVRRAVAALPEDARAMVTMRYELDIGYREIASALGVKTGTVKWKLHDALKKLGAALGEGEDI